MELTASVSLPIQIGSLVVWHDFFVSDLLVTPMILGIDFLQKFKIELDFENQVVRAAGHNVIWSQAPVSTPAKQACSVHVQDGQST